MGNTPLRAPARRVVRRLALGEETAMTHRPPPASQATACEVVGGWNDDGEAMRGRRDKTRREGGGEAMTRAPRSTPNHCHEQLLVGWKGVLRQCTGTRVGWGDGGNERRRPRQHTVLRVEGNSTL